MKITRRQLKRLIKETGFKVKSKWWEPMPSPTRQGTQREIALLFDKLIANPQIDKRVKTLLQTDANDHALHLVASLYPNLAPEIDRLLFLKKAYDKKMRTQPEEIDIGMISEPYYDAINDLMIVSEDVISARGYDEDAVKNYFYRTLLHCASDVMHRLNLKY
jgi:hypothetical protein